jgi:hypothetical protein
MNGPKATFRLSPFDSQVRTLVSAAGRSHSCQEETFPIALFDHLVGDGKEAAGLGVKTI